MRELEFLPAWYEQIRRRRRRVVLQGWLVTVVAAGLGLWSFLVHRNVRVAAAELIDVRHELTQTHDDLQKLAQLENLERQWSRQDQILAQLGPYVQSTRLIGTLDSIMPADMSLLALSLQTAEQAPVVNSLAAARQAQQSESSTDKFLRVRLQAVVPTDVELADFLAKLGNVPFFEQVAMTYARDRSEGGHVLREFEVTFALRLNPPQRNG